MAFPLEEFSQVYGFVAEEFEVFPLLCYPCKVFPHGGMIRAPGSEPHLFLNLGIYGIPGNIHQYKRYPMMTKVRKLEAKIRSVGGFQHTYCDTLQTREEFEEMYDHTLLRKMRKEIGSENFPTVYDKVKPEMDIMAWLAEE